MRQEYGRRVFLKDSLLAVAGGAAGGLLPKNLIQDELDVWKTPWSPLNPDSDTIAIFSDEHAAYTKHRENRQAATLTLDRLKDVVDHLSAVNLPFTMVVRLGDQVNGTDGEANNYQLYETGVSIFETLAAPVLHVLGNHDVWGISQQNLIHLYQRHQLNSFYGVKALNRCQAVWLDVEASPGKPGRLPDETLAWLEKTIYADTPTIIFSHYGLVPPHSMSGNPYFYNHPELAALTNGADVLKSLKGFPILAIVNGHTHMASYMVREGIPMVSVPAFVENIASQDPNYNPGVYSTLEIDNQNQLYLKSFVGSACFMNMEINRV